MPNGLISFDFLEELVGDLSFFFESLRLGLLIMSVKKKKKNKRKNKFI